MVQVTASSPTAATPKPRDLHSSSDAEENVVGRSASASDDDKPPTSHQQQIQPSDSDSDSYSYSGSVHDSNFETPKDCDAQPSAYKRLKHEREEISDGKMLMYPLLGKTLLKLGSEYAGGLDVARREIKLISHQEAAKLEEGLKKLQVLKMKHCIEEMNIMNEMVKHCMND